MEITPLMAYALGASAGLTAGLLFCMAILLHLTDPNIAVELVDDALNNES